MMSRIIPVVFVLIAIGLFFAYTNPTYSERVATLRSEIKSYDAALAAARKFEEKETQLIAERAAIPPEGLERVEAFLPDGVDNVQLILDLDALASRTGLDLSDFDTTETPLQVSNDEITLEAESQIESLELSVSATGSYASFKAFLEGVEKSLRPLDLVEVDIEDSETGVYTYQMKFRIYWLR